MIEKRIIGAFILLILLPTLTLGWFAYHFSLNEVKSERINTVGQVARAKHELLHETLQNQHEHLESLVKRLTLQCQTGKTLLEDCINNWATLFLKAEGAIGLTLRDIQTGTTFQTGKSSFNNTHAAFSKGQLARFSDYDLLVERTYYLTFSNQHYHASLTYPATVLDPLFYAPSELGTSGETFLADENGYFITEAKYLVPQGHTKPISATPMKSCLSGVSTNTLDKDYRDADIIHGYIFIPEIGSGCIMAHIEEQEAFAPLRLLRLKIIIVALVTLCFGSLIAFFISKQIATPIIKLTEVSRRIQQGDLRARANETGKDEISELAQSFNQLTGQLVSINLNLEQKVKERTLDLEWNEYKLNTLLHNVHEGIISIDEDSTIETFNRSAEEIFGYSADEVIGQNLSLLMFSQNQNEHRAYVREFLRTGIKHVIGTGRELVAKHKDGSPIDIFLTVSEARMGDKIVFVGSVSDISQRKAKESQLRMLATAFDLSGEAMIICDKAFNATYVNDAFAKITGFEKELILGKYTGLDHHTVCIDGHTSLLREALSQHNFLKGEIEKQNGASENLILWFNLSALRGQDNQVTHYIISFSDISDRKAEEERIRYLARHDSLTGLINRNTLYSQLEHSCILAERHNRKLAVLFIDLDGFKSINDNMGHAKGDEVLKNVAQTIKQHSRKSDIASRLGGDEFVLVMTDLKKPHQIAPQASLLCKALNMSINSGGDLYRLSASIGVSIFPDDATTAEELVNKADLAMYYAKTHGKDSVHYYQQRSQAQSAPTKTANR